MGQVLFTRPKRVAQPAMPQGEVILEPPPEIPPPQAKRNFGMVLRMLPMLAGGLAMGLMFMGGGGMGGRGPLGAVIGGLYVVAMMGMMVSQMGRGNDEQAQQLDANRRDYFRYLGQARREVREAGDEQRASVEFRQPDPAILWTIVGQSRMWERRANDEDFGAIRISVGTQQFSKRLIPPEAQPTEDLEPLTTGALRRFMHTHKLVRSVPLSINLEGFNEIRIVGDEERCRKLAFAMVCQTATWHAPQDVRLMVAAGPKVQDQWHWVKWLPHLQSPTEKDGVGEVRLFATSAVELTQLGARAQSGEEPACVVVVVDQIADVSATSLSTARTHAVGLVVAPGEAPRRVPKGVAVLEVDDEGHLWLSRKAKGNTPEPVRTFLGTADAVEMVYAEMLARAMSAYRLAPPSSGEEQVEEAVEEVKDFPTMLGVGDPLRLDVREAWRPRPLHDQLRIPFGVGEDGRPVELDIKESAQEGMGPHGICIGATGSGKSEFLRTLVLGMAMTHPPDQLNFVLVDFKGGATFLGLDSLPHVSATITNLEDELILVDRMQDAIGGELERRMEELRRAGNYKNRQDYEEARQEGADLEPMPSLFIIVDEFSELLTARPEFINLFLQIGRVGRSIAVHLLLASQRLEEGKLRGLDTFLSYRIALRTFSAAESRSVIGVPDAYELPSPPGNGYLKEGTKDLVRFKAAYVSGPWHASEEAPATRPDELRVPERDWVPPVLEFRCDYVPKPEQPASAPLPVTSSTPQAPAPADEEEETLLSIAVSRMRGHGWPARQVWLPPLDEPEPLDKLLGEIGEVPGRGLQVLDATLHGKLTAPLALVDKPHDQRRDPMWFEFTGAGGHLGVVGGPQSGKSMALRTGIAAMALTHTPDEVGFYCLDFGGGGLLSMRKLPHVGSVSPRLDVDRVRRTIAEMNSLRASRERMFGELGIDSMATYRRLRASGEAPRDRFASDVFLVIDGWATVKAEFEDLETAIRALATSGLAYGIHLWIASGKWSDMRSDIRESLQSRIELKLGDAFESEVNRNAQKLVPAATPGRGITSEGLHMLIGLPRVDGVSDPDSVTEGQEAFIEASIAAWHGEPAAEVRMLPDDLPVSSLPKIEHSDTDKSIPFAIDELELAPVYFDPATEPIGAFVGGPQSGKSNILATILRGIETRYGPDEAAIFIVDYRRSLLGVIDEDSYVDADGKKRLRYMASAPVAEQLFQELATALQARLPGPEVTQQQLRDRSWWQGKDIFIVIDDYEMVATRMGNPIMPLNRLIGQARDIGLHFVVARASGGVGRALYSDPLLSQVKDQINPALIMSGNKDEGALFGDVKPSPMPVGRGTWVTRQGKVLIQTAHAQR